MGSGPNGCFTPRTYQHVNLGVAGIVLYPIALLWSFVGTQYIADEYFSVALDGIVELYHIDPDVAGATILAVGTSFPELICGFASQFLSSGGDSGAVAFGVTVGSAIFNQLVIVAACALVSPGGEMRLTARKSNHARLDLPRDLRRVRRIVILDAIPGIVPGPASR